VTLCRVVVTLGSSTASRARACAPNLLATPGQAAALCDEFDLRVEVRGPEGLPVHAS
jgi:hypothetical protein